MNFIALSGRLTKDPEVRYTSDGMAVANYSIAVERPKKKDGSQEADFFNCTAFGKGGEFAEKYLKKGIKILISGSLQQDNWVDQGGNKRTTLKVIVHQHEFCESKEKAPVDDRDRIPDPKSGGTEFIDVPEGDEELPFNF